MQLNHKINLRQRAKEVRRRFFSEQSSVALLTLEKQRVKSLWQHPLFQVLLDQARSTVIGVYAPLKEEASTALLIGELSKQGFLLALPRVAKDAEMHFHSWSQNEPLIKSPLGILEPPEESTVVVPSLCIVPLLAFDEKKRRLGYGKGFYDRYFGQNLSVIKMGWAYGCQKFDAIISEEHDVSLDEVISEN